ncbi:hypothetical protein (Cop-C11.5R) [Cowpox virus]|nr:hypothetical protein (Cop-C11.5R) [Cowpox virus]
MLNFSLCLYSVFILDKLVFLTQSIIYIPLIMQA